ncbi:MAG: acyl-CoA dehydrogenase family protein [Deltaproteobacteria bacterium]|jgi:alkylation response protein AidB-like acyl-CoA dehydrogenase|nr:acyl-CoA dehydrogenase family protein [Deltaproteobacteria bacterium]
MGFKSDTEYLDFKRSITDFLWKEVDPLVPQMEEKNHIPKEILFPKFREMGLFGLIIPEAYGGMGLTTVQYLPILAELSKVSGAIRALIHVHLTSARAIVCFGREDLMCLKKGPLPFREWSQPEPCFRVIFRGLLPGRS